VPFLSGEAWRGRLGQAQPIRDGINSSACRLLSPPSPEWPGVRGGRLSSAETFETPDGQQSTANFRYLLKRARFSRIDFLPFPIPFFKIRHAFIQATLVDPADFAPRRSRPLFFSFFSRRTSSLPRSSLPTFHSDSWHPRCSRVTLHRPVFVFPSPPLTWTTVHRDFSLSCHEALFSIARSFSFPILGISLRVCCLSAQLPLEVDAHTWRAARFLSCFCPLYKIPPFTPPLLCVPALSTIFQPAGPTFFD